MTHPTGDTRLAAVVGWPVRHSLSPAIHNAAFAACELDWTYVALPVAPGRAADALVGMDALGIEALSVTMPHKAAIAAALDHRSAAATALGAVNCVHRDGDRLVGANTDGAGFVDSLRIGEGLDVSGMRCVVFGAGGAARAVVHALASAGVAEVAVCSRRHDPAVAATALAGAVGTVGSVEHLGTADLVVNATPVGMGDDAGTPFDVARCQPSAIVADLVYHPSTTPLLEAATERELRAVGGVGMLVHQAAAAFRLWTGVEPPIAVMEAAVRDRLG